MGSEVVRFVNKPDVEAHPKMNWWDEEATYKVAQRRFFRIRRLLESSPGCARPMDGLPRFSLWFSSRRRSLAFVYLCRAAPFPVSHAIDASPLRWFVGSQVLAYPSLNFRLFLILIRVRFLFSQWADRLGFPSCFNVLLKEMEFSDFKVSPLRFLLRFSRRCRFQSFPWLR